MALQTVERTAVVDGVAPRELYEVVTDYDCYPRVFPELTGARVLEAEGARRRVEFRARVVVDVLYVLDIVHDDDELETSWTFVRGEVVSDSEGGWRFSREGRGTRIHYRAGISVRAPLPQFVTSKISTIVLGKSIPNLFLALEKEALARKRYGR